MPVVGAQAPSDQGCCGKQGSGTGVSFYPERHDGALQMKHIDRRLLDKARDIAKTLVERNYAEELPVFDAFWAVFESRVQALAKLPPNKWDLRQLVAPRALPGLGFGEEMARGSQVPPISAAAAAAVLDIANMPQEVPLHEYIGQVVRLYGKRTRLVARMLPQLEELIYEAAQELVCGLVELGPSSPTLGSRPKGADEGIRVEFMGQKVFVRGKEKRLTEPWRMLEYFLWKDDGVHWTEGYLIFPKWWENGVGKGRKLFREKTTRCPNYLREECGLEIVYQGNAPESADRWRLASHNLSSNIPEAKKQYEAAKLRFEKNDFVGAREGAIEAIGKYPNHLESHVLLARCYEKKGFKDISAEEIERLLRPSWRYLRGKREAIQSLREQASRKEDKELQGLLRYIESHPVLSQVEAHAAVLDKWVRTNIFTEEDTTLAELKTVLKAIVSSADDSARQERIGELLRFPCVEEVVSQVRVGERGGLDIAARLFYSQPGETDFTSRLGAMSKRNFDSVRQFQKYLRRSLEKVGRQLQEELRWGSLGVPRDMVMKIRQVDQVERRLAQTLRRDPSDDELKKEIRESLGWDVEEIERVLECRIRVTIYPDDIQSLQSDADLKEDLYDIEEFDG